MSGIKSLWSRITKFIVNYVDKCFYKLGVKVALNPWRTITLSWLVVIVGSFGLFNVYQEKHPFKLWVPPDSDFAIDTQWILDRYNLGFRSQFVLATGENVLSPEILSALAKINEEINGIQSFVDGEKYSWEDVCFKVPVIGALLRGTVPEEESPKNASEALVSTRSKLDPSVKFNLMYCVVLKALQTGCLQVSLLDLWKYNVTTIESLQLTDVVEKLNKTQISPVLGHKMEYTNMLGGVKRNDQGMIVSAKAVLLVWHVRVNFTNVNMAKTGNLAGTEEWASEAALAWEEQFLQVLNNATHNVTDMKIYYEAGRTYGDLTGEHLFEDVDKLAIGITLMSLYIQLILSKFNWVEVKLMLGSVGLLCIGMAIVVSCGVCSLLGLPFGPVHNSLPFLLMGLGIDDMFVMKACWDHLTEAERKLPLCEKMGIMLQHAGVSIVITSFTDIVAFLVGSITILPSLQSFCLYAAVGVFFIFVFSVTFYVAVFTLDVQRTEAKRNGIIYCIKHPTFTPTPANQKSISQYIIHALYSKFILTPPVKVLVILFTIVMGGFSLSALFKLEQRFDPSWFIPENTYYSKFLEERKLYFPDMGYEASVFIGAINYTQELPKIYSVVEKLKNETDILYNIDSWTSSFRKFVWSNYKKDVAKTQLTDLEWRAYISKYLHSSHGARYQGKFKFSSPLQCGHLAPPLIVSSFDFNFKIFPGPKVYLPAMHKIKKIIRDANFETGEKKAFLWAKVFATWTSDDVIDVEVERNLELALVCVMICTFILITDIQVCFWIFLCVLLTLVNVCGFMQRWGLTIDIVSCVGLELAIGLCVDYAAHVGHTFLTLQGTREERALHTVTSIGAAVFYGGGSTLLALSVMSISETYIFKSFFKIFLLVIMFGLFHGIVFLPVVFSLIGPQSYQAQASDKSTSRNSQHSERNVDGQLDLMNLDESKI